MKRPVHAPRKPLDPIDHNGKLIYPCVRTMVYRQVLNEAHDGVTAYTIAQNLQTTVEVVLPHLKELCRNGHIELKARGALVRIGLQTFAKYVLYNQLNKGK